MEVYTMSDRQQKREAVQNLESMVIRKGQRKVSVSLSEQRSKFMVLQVVENMERETGIEPATNSLEGRP
jgi:hypothetical protein